MTNKERIKEAIETLNDILNEATEMEDSVCYVTSCDEEPLRIAIEALEKHIPKKPILRRQTGLFTIHLFHCPVCDDALISEWNKNIANPYCHHCGQAIDWSEEE